MLSVEKPPKKEATETFWRNILENDREHNHSAEWIKREEHTRSFAQEKKSQQAPEIDALVRDRKVFAWCHKIN